eukprot:CAMPEP_0179078420 /NCGR_PEP_ID=MMETSP0796-20121207/35118_1 /TAXON_ID=73915 /ORGANISM="Pyrodinium bahamense, Strain pbaha01" /LENGTH=226 /DNA_ID=CAMNT_0020775725 /DNA_START=286 /DNA_END=962 /DNA_ORIENTATION=+
MTAKQKRDTRYMFAESALSFARISRTFCAGNGEDGTCGVIATIAAAAMACVVWAVVVGAVVRAVVRAVVVGAAVVGAAVVGTVVIGTVVIGAVFVWAVVVLFFVMLNAAVECMMSGMQPTTVPLHSVPLTHFWGWQATPTSWAGAVTSRTRTHGSPSQSGLSSRRPQHSASESSLHPLGSGGPLNDVVSAVVVECMTSCLQPTTVPLHSVTNGPLTHRSGWQAMPT